MSQLWINGDGLAVKFGTLEGKAGTAGTYEDMIGNRHLTEVIFNFGDLTVTPGGTILDQNTVIPKGCRIESVELEVETAFSTGSSPTLDVGLIKEDQTTELDYNGFIAAAAASTIDTAGKRLSLVTGSTAVGALIGTTLTDNGLLVANYNTAAFTTGRGVFRVFWYSL